MPTSSSGLFCFFWFFCFYFCFFYSSFLFPTFFSEEKE